MLSPGIRDETYYRTLLEALYTGLEARDTAGYQWHESDRWTQCRTPLDWTRHLEAWIDLGGEVAYESHGYTHTGHMVFAARYRADDDSRAQARLHAAIHSACEYLLGTPLPHGVRILTIAGAEITRRIGDFVEVSITFTLRLPR